MREIREIDFKHNGSEVVGRQPWCARIFESGEPLLKVPERIVLDSRFSLDLRGFAAWAYCQSTSWVFTVEDCCARLGLTRGKWRTVSTEGHAAGFIKQTKERVSTAQGRSSWRYLLQFNFTVFEAQAPMCKAISPEHNLSTGVQKQPVAHAHVRERSKSTSHGSGRKQPVARLVENRHKTPPLQYKQEIPPPHAGACLAGGGEVKAVQENIQWQGLAAMLGLRGAHGLEVEKASRGATGQQLEAAASAFKAALATGSVRDPQAFAVALARRASRGEVTTPRRKDGGVEAGPSPQQAAQVRLADIAGRRLASPVPGGESWIVEVGGFVRDGLGALLHPDVAMKLIAKLDAGDLELL